MLDILNDYIMSPNDAETNYTMARYYDELGQTASALSYYLRAAERTDDDLLKFECLLHGAICFEKQGARKFTMKGLLQQAVSTAPKRPEGYYHLSRFYEKHNGAEGKWLDSYTIASIGLQVSDFDNEKSLRNSVDYPGKYGLLFQKAAVAWHVGLTDESRDTFMDLHLNYDMDDAFATAVRNNLINMGAFYSKSLTLYDKSKHKKLRYQFQGSESIEQNYSEAYQDMFVLSMLDGKKNGTYLEIGAGDPTYGNNTYLLEKDFGWKGVSFDISEEFVKGHHEKRKNKCILKDATAINYTNFLSGLGMPTEIDYLQIDVDPADVSFNVLLTIPFEKYKFAVVTFEHDHYTDPKSDVREKARKYLSSYGYKLVAPNISPDENRPYEDWFVHPDLVSINNIETFRDTSDETKKAEKYMMV